MNEAHLDLILNELSKDGTNQIEATEDVMEKLNLKGESLLHNDEIAYLISQGYLRREVINGYQDRQGNFNAARYFLGLTPQGLKYVNEGGFTAKSGYAKKTLTVAMQSRNWSIAAVGIAIIALILQLYYGSCNNAVTTPSATLPLKDTVAKGVLDINRNIQDSQKVQSKLVDSASRGSVKLLPSKKKKATSSGLKN